MANPDLMRQMMENPFVQQLMSNPDVMRQMITSNPQMRELMEVSDDIINKQQTESHRDGMSLSHRDRIGDQKSNKQKERD
jgi:hypothetical protein